MKPVIQREIDEVLRQLRDLERRLKNEKDELGYRASFGMYRRGDVPAPTPEDRGRVLGVDGWFTVTGSGGGGLSTVEVDNLTISGNGSAASPLSATLLSGTINARFVSLSGSIDGRFNTVLTAVSHDSTLTGDGTAGSPLSASPLSGTVNSAIVALSATLNSAVAAILTSSQAWTQTANGTEGTTLVAALPHPFPDTSYYAFVTNYTGSSSPVFKVTNKTAYNFQVVSTAPFSSGDKLDLLAISGGFGPVADGTGIATLSGTIHAEVMFKGASIWQTGSQTVKTGGSGTVLVFDNIEYDRGGFFSTSFRTRLTSPSDGFYMITANVTFSANATGFREVFVKKNANGDPNSGVTISDNKRMAVTTANNVTYGELAVATYLSASDYIELFSFQNSGATLMHSSAQFLNFQISKLGH